MSISVTHVSIPSMYMVLHAFTTNTIYVLDEEHLSILMSSTDRSPSELKCILENPRITKILYNPAHLYRFSVRAKIDPCISGSAVCL